MSRAIIEEALALVGEPWHLPDEPALDAEGCIALQHAAGLDILLTYLPKPSEAIILYAELGAAVDPEAVFRRALEAMHLWQAGDNVTLGVLPGTDTLTACLTAPATEDLVQDLAPLLDHFAQRALSWIDIAAGESTDPDTPADPPDAPHNTVWG